MSVLTIRAHRRYAMRMPAKFEQEGRQAAECLLIEISQAGIRVSNLGERKCAVGEEVTLVTKCGTRLPGSIRWAHDGLAGVQLAAPLYLRELSDLLNSYHRDYGDANLSYGT